MLPVLEDANAVQLALMQVMQLLANGQMDQKMAGLMLYALQTASVNLRSTKFEAFDVTHVVIDRNDVHRTAIGGPQWFEEDFADDEGEAEAEEESEVEEADSAESEEAELQETSDEVQAEVGAEAAAATATRHEKEPDTQQIILEARKKAQAIVHKWVLDTVAAKALAPPG